jgi:hypothetical protein
LTPPSAPPRSILRAPTDTDTLMASRAGSARPPDQDPAAAPAAPRWPAAHAPRAVCPLTPRNHRPLAELRHRRCWPRISSRTVFSPMPARAISRTVSPRSRTRQPHRAVAGPAFVGLRLQCRRPLVEPVTIDRALGVPTGTPPDRRVRPAAPGSACAATTASRAPAGRLRRCTTCQPHAKPLQPLMPHQTHDFPPPPRPPPHPHPRRTTDRPSPTPTASNLHHTSAFRSEMVTAVA